jgi:hypothetical protein
MPEWMTNCATNWRAENIDVCGHIALLAVLLLAVSPARPPNDARIWPAV